MITNRCNLCTAGTFNMCIVLIEKAFNENCFFDSKNIENCFFFILKKNVFLTQNCCRWDVMLSISAMFR